MQLTIDSLGEPLRGFQSLRDELVEAGKKFDAESLAHIPYEKLAWCATGMAGAAACPLSVVQTEKRNRRERFLAMEEREVHEVKTLLQIEQMHEDVWWNRLWETALRWEDIRMRQKVWFKLNCIANHVDNVMPRMREAIALLGTIRETHDLPPDFARFHVQKLENLTLTYPGMMSDSMFRTHVASLALEIKKLLPEEEQRVCEAEVLYNYSCTSDCYRPLL